MAIGINWAEIWAPVWAQVWTQSPPAPQPTPVDTTQTPAGSSRSRRQQRRRYQVEIDGQVFEARDQSHALEILEQARLLAERAAHAKADDIVERATPKVAAARVVKRVSIKTPSIRVPDELRNEAAKTRVAIDKVYRDASVTAELRLLLALSQATEREAAQAARDEEDMLLLLH